VLFNNAGVVRLQPMLEVTHDEWDRVMSVNLRAVFFVTPGRWRAGCSIRGLMPDSELSRQLIQTASIASYRGGNHLMTPIRPLQGPCGSASTRSAAQALAPHPITSNCSCARAPVETPGAIRGVGLTAGDGIRRGEHGPADAVAGSRRLVTDGVIGDVAASVGGDGGGLDELAAKLRNPASVPDRASAAHTAWSTKNTARG